MGVRTTESKGMNMFGQGRGTIPAHTSKKPQELIVEPEEKEEIIVDTEELDNVQVSKDEKRKSSGKPKDKSLKDKLMIKKSNRGTQRTIYFRADVYEFYSKIAEEMDTSINEVVNQVLLNCMDEF